MLTVGIALTPLLLTVTPQVSAGPVAFNWDWMGTPASAQPWQPGSVNNWDLIVHDRDHQSTLDMVMAQHGSDCAPYPATHPVSTYPDAVFICKNHLMTALNGGSYAEIVMTPAQLLDFSNGGSVQFSVSTSKTNNRDWIDLWVSPFNEQLLLPSGGIPPDLQGPTRNAVDVVFNAAVPTSVNVQEFKNYVETAFDGTGQTVEGCVAPIGGVSATRRDPVQVSISRTHIKVDLLVNGAACTLFNRDINDLGFSLGVVQIGHHSYSPDEAFDCNIPGCVVNRGAGAGNTFHWSSFSMSPAVPFTMLRGDMPLTGISAGTTKTVKFAAPAPANSFLRFSAMAKRGAIIVSSNGGPGVVAQEQLQHGDGADGISEAHHIAYWTPIPAGTTSVTFSAQDGVSSQGWVIQDVSIWSQTALGAAVPPPPPPPTAAPSPTPTAAPSPTPSPTAKPPVSITAAPCTVLIGGVQQSGTCTGTFQP